MPSFFKASQETQETDISSPLTDKDIERSKQFNFAQKGTAG